MNLTHSSKGVALAVLLAITVVMAGTATAISVSGEMPSPTEEGTEVSMEVTIDSPMTDQPSEWNLVGQTDLENATWFVQVRDSAGQTISEQQSVKGQQFSQPLSSEAPVPATVTVRVSGRVPNLSTADLSYENKAAEEYTVMALTQDGERTLEGGEFSTHRYEANSKHKQAREVLDNASAVVENSSNEQAREDLDRAVAFYNNGDFGRAIDLAEDAEQSADEGGLPIVLIGGAVVALVLILGGGVYYWRSQQTSEYKLQ